MKLVQLTEAIPGWLEGEVLNVDDGSAKSLVDRGVAKEYDPAAKNAKDPVPHADTPGANHIVQVVDADTPASADTAPPSSGSAAEVLPGGTPDAPPAKAASK